MLPLEQGWTAFSLLPAALRFTFAFMNYGRQCVQDILNFALHLFCLHTLSLRCFHTFVWPSFCSVLYTHTADKEFSIMHRHHNFYILNYIIMCTAASIFIEGSQAVHPCFRESRVVYSAHSRLLYAGPRSCFGSECYTVGESMATRLVFRSAASSRKIDSRWKKDELRFRNGFSYIASRRLFRVVSELFVCFRKFLSAFSR